jgi:hypothetical protein
LFLFPKILFDTISYPDPTFAKTRPSQIKKGNSSETNQNIKELLNPYLVTNPFLQSGFNLSKMALDLQLSERVLSNYFNYEFSYRCDVHTNYYTLFEFYSKIVFSTNL